jgi:hypothetical protein
VRRRGTRAVGFSGEGRSILERDRPDLLFECHRANEPECAVFAFLEDLSYSGYCFFDRGFAPVAKYRELQPRMHKKNLVDFVFVPRERGLGPGHRITA